MPHPVTTLEELAQRDGAFLLDGGAVSGGRRSFAGADPSVVLQARGGSVVRAERTRSGWHRTESCDDPFEALERTVAAGGFRLGVGYLAYDLGRRIEDIGVMARDDLQLPDLHVAFYDEVDEFVRAPSQQVDDGRPAPPPPELAGPLESSLPRGAYLAAVRAAKDHLVAGDCYQVNLSQRIRVPLRAGADPVALYRRLRQGSPAPFGAYLDLGDFRVLSNSPERFLRYEARSRTLDTWPIKGTRRRHADPRADAEAAAALLADDKERAEHVMIVDLARNDLGRVCVPGSIETVGLLHVESYAHVHHLVTRVRGQARAGAGLASILRATFPGGSITGAPKVESMRIIERLEPVRRGVYCGALGWFEPDGSFDLALPIRTAILRDDALHVHVGGGVVIDSTPEGEYEESWLKATAFLDALGLDVSPDADEDTAVGSAAAS